MDRKLGGLIAAMRKLASTLFVAALLVGCASSGPTRWEQSEYMDPLPKYLERSQMLASRITTMANISVILNGKNASTSVTNISQDDFPALKALFNQLISSYAAGSPQRAALEDHWAVTYRCINLPDSASAGRLQELSTQCESDLSEKRARVELAMRN